MEVKGLANLLKREYAERFSVRLLLNCKFTGKNGLINNLKHLWQSGWGLWVVGSV